MPAKKTKSPASLKLNLLPPHVAAARKTRMAVVLTVLVLLLTFIGMGLWWQSNAAQISRLNEELQQKTAQAQEVQAIQNKAQQIRSEVGDISSAIQVLDDIRNSGKEWSTLLQKIREWVPEEVRLTSLTLQGGMTNAQSVVLTGYTTSVMRLRDFYSQLSQSPLFSSVQLQAVDKNGVPVPVTGLPPVLPKERPKGPEVTTELAPSGQPSAPPGAGEAVGGSGMGMHGGPGGPPMGGPGMGMHGGPGGPPMGGPGMGIHGGPGGPPMGGPGMGMHGGPGGPPMGGPGMMMGGPGMMMGPGMMGGMQQSPIVRDPVAPRNAVYFAIIANLAQPVQVAKTLAPPAPAGQPFGGMPGGPSMMGPGGMEGPAGMGPGGMEGPAGGGPGGPPPAPGEVE